MAKAKMGAIVRFCGHVNACFVADIWEIEGVNVVVANGDLKKHLIRDKATYENATHHVVDYPRAGYWKESRGFFVVPSDQVTEVKRGT